MHVGCLRLIELEIRTTANSSHGDAQLAQLVRQALRGTFDYGDSDCYVVLRRILREFVCTRFARASCAVKFGPCVRTAGSQHPGSIRNLVILANRRTRKITPRSLRKLRGDYAATFWNFSASGQHGEGTFLLRSKFMFPAGNQQKSA